MNDAAGQLLSRLIDGDAVDPDALSAALETEDGRRLLVDFARARDAVATDVAPSAAWRRATLGRLAGGAPPVRALSYRAAAVLVVSALALGAAAERWRETRPPKPPQAVRVLQFDAADWHAIGGDR